GGCGPAENHSRGDDTRSHKGRSPLAAGPPVLPDPRARGVRRLPQSRVGRDWRGIRLPAVRRPRKRPDGPREAYRTTQLRELLTRCAPYEVNDQPALVI